ncbi:ATP-binding protein [Pedobacter antarcticus]|uniref:ATP-binding protein n=1 Tax=Pedobacter antarcticus TaxID=34086 RepID=UPI00088B75AD|nr:ATP-binding protein [Pedobacter antarcticus]SDM61276.1 PAS domain S-box-containing protein [Pedobacter antarcticus]
MIENTFGMNIIPENDIERLAALQRYRIMDTPSEASFDNLAKLCAKIFNVPISLISLVDAERVFFKANIGMGTAKEANRGKSLCALAVLNTDITVFQDALKEPCLIANPNVAGNFGLRFYAGAPLITHDGFLIGTLCIIDKQPRSFSKQEEEILSGLATAVMDQIELRISALDEIQNHRETNLLLSEQQEELQVMNEELTSSNEELRLSQEELIVLNKNLAESESRFRNLIKESPTAIAILKGRELIIDCANDTILKMWDKDTAVLGKPLHLALPSIQEQTIYNFLDQVYLSGEPHYGNEARLSLPHGETLKEVYVNFTYQPIKGVAGGRDLMIVANEVTEQVIARKAAEDLSERLKIALDASKLGSTEVDLATGIMQSTDQFKANYGYTKEETFNYPDLFNTMIPEYRDGVKKLVQEAIDNNSVYSAEYPVKWRDGSIHWISARGRARYDINGKANRMVGMTADITESKLFEQRKDDFLSIASHELKTPVTSLKGALQLLDRIKEKPFTPMHIKLIEQANRSMDKMSVLVDDLLNMNRLTEGNLKLQKSTFTISEMLNLCCNHVRMEGKFELIVEGDKDLQVYADEHRIDQVVVNFVNNAVKYAADAEKIYLKIDKIDQYARISVKDQGPGIPAHVLPHLFDRYYRVNHDSQNYTGLGLGLYICSEIIKRHDGEIGVESEMGDGSTFWFTLPLFPNT